MRAWFEIAAVLLSAAFHLLTRLGPFWPGVDQLVLGLGWLGYVAVRARTPGVLAGWGLRRTGLLPCSRAAALVLVAGIAGCAGLGLVRGGLPCAHLWPLLLLYPLWGFVQQLLVLGILASNLQGLGVSRRATLAIAALGFAAVHVPDWPLTLATLLLGFCCATLFLRHRNLWPLALLHGWLGALFYRWVLGRDPWQEILNALS